MTADPSVYISFVAPAYNEVENLETLRDEVKAAADEIGRSWEFVVVDDGSTDGSRELLAKMRGDTPQLRVILMDANSGQTAALEAGLRAARGAVIATMDADLQNDPSELPRMLEHVESGECDMLTGWRKNRRDTGLRRWISRNANRFRNWMTGESIHDAGCSLKVFRREVAESFKLFNGLHRFLPTLARMGGFTVKEIPVNHRPRVAGVAKYGVRNRIKAIRDIMALRWMQSRAIRYTTTEMGEPQDDGEARRDVE